MAVAGRWGMAGGGAPGRERLHKIRKRNMQSRRARERKSKANVAAKAEGLRKAKAKAEVRAVEVATAWYTKFFGVFPLKAPALFR